MQIVFLFYEGMTALDAIGPHEVLCRYPSATVKRVALNKGPIITDSTHLTLFAEYSLHEIDHADVLVVPGAGSATTLGQFPEVHSWLQMLHQTTSWTTSVCTGSLILAAAGLLTGKKATSHWAAIDRLSKWGVIPTDKRVVQDGKIITAAGVSAGIDMALLLAEKIGGIHFAHSMQLGLEYDPAPPFDVGSPKKANPEIVEILRHSLQTHFEPL